MTDATGTKAAVEGDRAIRQAIAQRRDEIRSIEHEIRELEAAQRLLWERTL